MTGQDICLPTEYSPNELVQAQANDDEVKKIIKDMDCSLNFRKILCGSYYMSVYCNLTGEALRLYIPSPLREFVFCLFHNPAHPSSRNTDRVIHNSMRCIATSPNGVKHVRTDRNKSLSTQLTFAVQTSL